MSNQAEDASTEKAWHWDCGDEWTAMDSRGDREREREKERQRERKREREREKERERERENYVTFEETQNTGAITPSGFSEYVLLKRTQACAISMHIITMRSTLG